jgi:hypothetical protein
MGNDGGYVVCFIVGCMRRTEESWTASSLGWADGWGTRAAKAIGLESLGRGSVTLTMLPRNGRRVFRKRTTAKLYIVL